MKIAIKGHESRGKEVIQILESLGGRNTFNYNGDFIRTAYFIGMDYSIYGFCTDSPKVGFKVYTIEEFKKEFPFKIGDKVIHKEFNDFFEVISFDPESPYPYKIKGVCEFNTKSFVLTKWQPKMKEERFVTLTLDKAKEWYNKGGELKEIALQAFTEKELNPFPRSWEEYISKIALPKVSIDKMPISSLPEKYIALYKLEKLRDCWRQGWIQTPTDTGYRINKTLSGDYTVLSVGTLKYFLAFPTKEMAEEFLKCFRDLIEKAGDLI